MFKVISKYECKLLKHFYEDRIVNILRKMYNYITTVSLNTCSYINGLNNSELSESNKAEVGLVNQ